MYLVLVVLLVLVNIPVFVSLGLLEMPLSLNWVLVEPPVGVQIPIFMNSWLPICSHLVLLELQVLVRMSLIEYWVLQQLPISVSLVFLEVRVSVKAPPVVHSAPSVLADLREPGPVGIAGLLEDRVF